MLITFLVARNFIVLRILATLLLTAGPLGMIKLQKVQSLYVALSHPRCSIAQDILRAQLESSLVRGGLQQANAQQTKSWEERHSRHLTTDRA